MTLQEEWGAHGAFAGNTAPPAFMKRPEPMLGSSAKAEARKEHGACVRQDSMGGK